MPIRLNKKKDAYVFARRLKRRLYTAAAFVTITYVALSLVRFHGQFPYLPYELAITWAVFLVCYVGIKEVLRWRDIEVGEEEIYNGELWVGVVLAGMAWMIAWNIGRVWIFHLSPDPFPGDYEATAIETIVLYTMSIISSFLYKYNKVSHKFVNPKARRSVRSQPKQQVAVAKNPIMVGPAPSPGVEAVLAKAPPADDKTQPPPNKNS